MSRIQVKLPGLGFPITVERQMTHTEFEIFCRGNPELRIEQMPDGKPKIRLPVSFISGDRENEIAIDLGLYARQYGGRALSSSTGFKLPDDSVRSPDASYVTDEQLEPFTEEDFRHFLAVVPVFVTEILSPTDSIKEAKEKMQDVWIANGVKLAWLVDIDNDHLWIYRADGTVDLVTPLDIVVTGEKVLPGFEFDLKWFKK